MQSSTHTSARDSGPGWAPLELLQTSMYVTPGKLVAPILLGQRDILYRLGLVHRNAGPRPHFRFLP